MTGAREDVDPGALTRARAQLDERVARDVAKGRTTAADAQAAAERLAFVPDLDAAAADADVVIEAVVEKLDVKRELFARLDAVCPPEAVPASNSSGFVPSQLADATTHPDRVCNMHWYVYDAQGTKVGPADPLRTADTTGGS
jgi:3-hydroxybutyryl-CoA dehydrogenase